MSTMTETPAKILDRIRGLLAKAERTDNPHEAEAFAAKAAELMDKYRVDSAAVRGTGEATFSRDTYYLGGCKYLRASRNLLLVVANHYGVAVAFPVTGNSKYGHMIGDPDDIIATITIFESLIVQRDRAALAVTGGTRYRNSFAYGYASRIYHRLAELRAAAVQVATTGGDTMALEVFDRRSALERFLDEQTDVQRKKPNLNRPTVDPAGMVDGDAAARRADLGTSGRLGGGGPRAIGGAR